MKKVLYAMLFIPLFIACNPDSGGTGGPGIGSGEPGIATLRISLPGSTARDLDGSQGQEESDTYQIILYDDDGGNVVESPFLSLNDEWEAEVETDKAWRVTAIAGSYYDTGLIDHYQAFGAGVSGWLTLEPNEVRQITITLHGFTSTFTATGPQGGPFELELRMNFYAPLSASDQDLFMVAGDHAILLPSVLTRTGRNGYVTIYTATVDEAEEGTGFYVSPYGSGDGATIYIIDEVFDEEYTLPQWIAPADWAVMNYTDQTEAGLAVELRWAG